MLSQLIQTFHNSLYRRADPFFSPSLFSVLPGVTMHVARQTPAQKPTTITPTCITSTGITAALWALSARNISSRTLASMSAHHTWDPGYNKCVLCICAHSLSSMFVPATLDGSRRTYKLKGLKGLVEIATYTLMLTLFCVIIAIKITSWLHLIKDTICNMFNLCNSPHIS